MNTGSVPTDSTSRSLLRRAGARDPDAWQTLCAMYGPVVYQWCRRAGLQAADAADVVQEVFRSVAGAIDGFQRDKPGATFRGWLWTIARNCIRDHFRARAAQPRALGGLSSQAIAEQLTDDPPDDSDVQIQERLRGGLASRALALMKRDFESRTWRAFMLTAVEERPPAEVAADLGMSVASVYQARSRVLRRLRQELQGLDPVE